MTMTMTQHGQAGGPAAIAALIATTERLADVLHQETTLLRTMNLRAAAEVQLEKATLAETYERCVRALQAGGGTVAATMSPRNKMMLRATVERLAEESVNNERALRAAREVNERVLAAIVEAAREQRTATHSYGNPGPIGAVSLSVDRQL